MSLPKTLLWLFLPNLLLIVIFIDPINGFEPRKLDEATGLPGSSDPTIKCGGCSPCGAQCYLSPPPPPPSLPPPPPPPPPKPKKPPNPSTGYYCPPPPSSAGFIYATGPPGNLYPIDQSFSGSCRNYVAPLPAILGFGFLGFLLILFS